MLLKYRYWLFCKAIEIKPFLLNKNPGHVFAMIIILFVLVQYLKTNINKEMNIESIKQSCKQTNTVCREKNKITKSTQLIFQESAGR